MSLLTTQQSILPLRKIITDGIARAVSDGRPFDEAQSVRDASHGVMAGLLTGADSYERQRGITVHHPCGTGSVRFPPGRFIKTTHSLEILEIHKGNAVAGLSVHIPLLDQPHLLELWQCNSLVPVRSLLRYSSNKNTDARIPLRSLSHYSFIENVEAAAETSLGWIFRMSVSDLIKFAALTSGLNLFPESKGMPTQRRQQNPSNNLTLRRSAPQDDYNKPESILDEMLIYQLARECLYSLAHNIVPTESFSGMRQNETFSVYYIQPDDSYVGGMPLEIEDGRMAALAVVLSKDYLGGVSMSGLADLSARVFIRAHPKAQEMIANLARFVLG